MLKGKENLDISYLGSDKIQISKIEKKLCNFYKVKFSTEDKEILKFDIANKDFFILNTFTRNANIDKTQFFANDEDIVMVVFDEELVVNKKRVKSRYKTVMNDIKEKFLYSLAVYHLKNDDVESAKVVIAQTGNINGYTFLENCKSLSDKNKIIEELTSYIREKSTMYESKKVNIKVINPEEESCLIEILEEIVQDKDSHLLYDYSYMYNRITSKTDMIEDNYTFIRPKFGYGEIVEIVIGSQKTNISVKVKVNGEVINKENNLKLDAYIFREYALVLNGYLNMDVIWCKLSKKLKSKYRRNKLIKSIDKIYGEEIVTLDLRKINITNERVLNSLTIDKIAESLYEIERLKVRQKVLRSLLKEITINTNNISCEKKLEVLKKYRVNENGLYTPLAIEKNTSDFSVYLADILEWKVEKFQRKNEEIKVLDEYKKLMNDDIGDSINRLLNELKNIKEKKKSLEYKVNRVRLSSGILDKTIFFWEKEIEKEKKETDNILNINSVVGDKVKVSTKTINDVVIRQDSYKALIRYD